MSQMTQCHTFLMLHLEFYIFCVVTELSQSWSKKNSTYYMNMWNLIIITWNKSIISSEQDTSLMAVLACFSCSKIYL